MKRMATLFAVLLGVAALAGGCDRDDTGEPQIKAVERDYDVTADGRPATGVGQELGSAGQGERGATAAGQGPAAPVGDAEGSAGQAPAERGANLNMIREVDEDPGAAPRGTMPGQAQPRRTPPTGMARGGEAQQDLQRALPGEGPNFQPAQKIGDSRQIPLTPELRSLLDAQEFEQVSVEAQVCVNEQGEPQSVMLTTPSALTELDVHVQRELSSWRYQPATVNGQPIPSCKHLTFQLQMDQAGQARPVLSGEQAAEQGEPSGEVEPQTIEP